MEGEEPQEEAIEANKYELNGEKEYLKSTNNISLQDEKEQSKTAEEYKLDGNELFRQASFDAAITSYQKALDISSPDEKNQRAIYHANIAACYIRKELWDQAVNACTLALKEDPLYIKALHRRAQANEKIATWCSLDAALLEKNIPQTSPILKSIKESISRIKPKLSEAQEKEKTQALNQLKNLGNNILGKFGLSTDNFKITQDPQTKGYSISFQK
ncbi:hypothetical protein PCANB_000907 [Pneumocystis canis]|nr:hypothetical protein PCANB_000907 [Pneumocystis canis]